LTAWSAIVPAALAGGAPVAAAVFVSSLLQYETEA